MATTTHATIVIDDFSSRIDGPSVWPKFVDSETASMSSVELGQFDVLGGTRSSTLRVQSFESALDRIDAMIDPFTDGGVLDYNSSVTGNGALDLAYGTAESLNASFAEQTGLQFNFDGLDLGIGSLLAITVRLESDTQGTQLLSTSVYNGGLETITVRWDTAETTGFDFSDVDRIFVTLDGGMGADFRLDSITTFAVPAPGSLALLGLAGCAVRRRRRD
ncbi:MAG: PEP-CTERM sorting domain-containing protein [Planctomycetota bacterium]